MHYLGAAGPDKFAGDDEDDTFEGLGGNDTIRGGGGDDLIDSGADKDWADGGDGDDTILGGAGDDGRVYVYVGSPHSWSIGFAPQHPNGMLIGHAGNDLIYGGRGSDVAFGGYDSDTLYGGGDIDFLDGGAGNDLLYGNGDRDILIGDSASPTGSFPTDPTINGGPGGSDTAYGGAGDDLILGGAADDYLRGGDGDDIIHGGESYYEAPPEYLDAADIVWGEAGNDYLEGGEGDDLLVGGAGDDTLWGVRGSDTLDGGDGLDRVHYRIYASGNAPLVFDARSLLFDGSVTLDENEGTDVYIGIEGFQIDSPYAGDTVYGSVGHDELLGWYGDDWLDGYRGDDTVFGGDGKDTLIGGQGLDTLAGGAGDDVYLNPNSDIVLEAAGEGVDRVENPTSYSLRLRDNIENLVITGPRDALAVGNASDNEITTGIGNDRLNGREGSDTLVGGEGDDTLVGGPGADHLYGGEGNDTYINPVDELGYVDVISESAWENSYDTILTDRSYTVAASQSIERIILTGTRSIDATGWGTAELIIGNSGRNFLDGVINNDTLRGGDGNDTLHGGEGNDRLQGGTGRDVFMFKPWTDWWSTADGVDTIIDFSIPDDRFDLGGTTFTAMSENGTNTRLVHARGQIIVKGVTGLDLDDWNALVIGTDTFAAATPDQAPPGDNALNSDWLIG